MKNRKFFDILLFSFLGVLILLAGCTIPDLYECPDGTFVTNSDECILTGDNGDNGNLDNGNGGNNGDNGFPAILSPSSQVQCPDSCDDYNSCTGDICGKKTGYLCEHVKLNGQVEGCEGSEKQCVQGKCTQQEPTEIEGDFDAEETAAPSLSTQTTNTASTGSEKTAKWTFFVYLDADNNLEAAGISDLNEMEMAGSTSEVNIIVQIDRNPSNDYQGGYDGTNGDWSTTKRYYVLKDTNTQQIKSKELKDLGEVNMGKEESLISFLEWGIDKYPADHYAVILWNHGAGFDVAFDESSNNDYISLEELENSIKAAKEKAGKKIDIIGFDACLMGMLEVDYALKDSADIRIGSEETEPFDGWNYEMALTPLVNNPDLTPEEFAEILVDKYYESYEGTWDESSVTQSAVDLNKLDSALDSLAEFSNELQLEVQSGGSNTILSARNGVQQYYSEVSIDLLDFADIIKQTTTNPNLQTASENLIQEMEKIIINNRAGESMKYSHGIAVYFPPDKYYYDSTYEQQSIGKSHNWDEFLQSYFTGGTITTGIDVKNFYLSSNSVSPSEAVTVTATISGKSISLVELYVLEETSYEGVSYLIVMDNIQYNPPSYVLEDGSHITNWQDGDNYFNRKWNAYSTAITDGTTQAFAVLTPYGRASSQYYVEGIYEKGSESFVATIDFNMETGEMLSVYNTETFNEIIPAEGDKFTIYRYAIDEDGNAVNIPSKTLTYGQDKFTAGYYGLPEGIYYLALFAYDSSGKEDYEGDYITVKVSGHELCSDGTPYGECALSPTFAGYKCVDGTLVYDESCADYLYCSDGTPYGECSEISPGYLCNENGFLEFNEQLCLSSYGDYCEDGTPNGECSYWYDGWSCVNGEFEFDESCYFGITDYTCSDGTVHGECSFSYPGYACYYGELYQDANCIDYCDDGSFNGYCSVEYPGYLCTDGDLEYSLLCDYWNYQYYCWDGTIAGYCSVEYPGYYCDYDGDLHYNEGCGYYGYGNSCSDGTSHSQCSETNIGSICWNGFLFEAEECGYTYNYDCSDGTLDGYCSSSSLGYACYQGELYYDEYCIGSCEDGTTDGYCSYYSPGYLCSGGQLVYSYSCEYYGYNDTTCSDGTLDGYCSEVYPSYACYDGGLYYDSYCDEYYHGYCVDGTSNGYCSVAYPGYGCIDGDLLYLSECDDYGYSSCEDGTAAGYCSSSNPGYWCNYYGQLAYHSGCDYSDYCTDGTTIGYCSSSNPGYWCNYNGNLEYSSICEEVYQYTPTTSCYDWLYDENVQSGYCTQDDALYCYQGTWYTGSGYCYESTTTSCYDSSYNEYIYSGYCTQDDYYYCYEGTFYDGDGYCY